MNGYDTLVYTLQWQYSQDGEAWADLKDATGMNMDLEITRDNFDYYWRVVVKVMDVLED